MRVYRALRDKKVRSIVGMPYKFDALHPTTTPPPSQCMLVYSSRPANTVKGLTLQVLLKKN